MLPIQPLVGPFMERYRRLVTAVMLNVPLIALILLLDLRHVDQSAIAWSYVASVIAGYYVFPLLLVLTVVFVLGFAFHRAALAASAALLSIYVYYLLLDSFVYGVFKFHVDFFWLEFLVRDFRGLGVSGSLVAQAVVALVAVVALEIGIFVLANRIKVRHRLLASFSLAAALALASSQVVHVFAYDRNDTRITQVTPHFPFYVPTTSHRHASKYRDLLPMGQEAAALAWAPDRTGSLNYPLRPIRLNRPDARKAPNIMLILLESWRSDTMDKNVSPNIYAFSRKSSVFLNHYSSGNSTVAGVFGMFYGLHPTYWTAVKANSTQIDNPVLIDILRDEDYRFGIFAESGFERHKIKDTVFHGITIQDLFEGRTYDRKDEGLTGEVLSFLREQKGSEQPFMAMAFYKATHFNYSYDKLHAKYLPTRKVNMARTGAVQDHEMYLNDYRNAVYFDDDLVGQIIDELESLEMLSNTIVIISSDHGEEFDDNSADYWGHGSNFTEYQTKVPLIVYFPDREPQQVTNRTSHIDIAPTLAQEYLGCTNDIADYSDGINMLRGSRGDQPLVIASYFNHAFVVGDNVYAVYPMHTRKYKLGDIKKKAPAPDLNVIRALMNDISHFYASPVVGG